MSERGQQSQNDGGSRFNAMAFMIKQMLNRLSTSTLVEVVSCTNDGGLEPVGFVDVKPLVNQLDGNNNATPHGTIHNVPYFRYQGGANAVIIDPVIGDVGMAMFADHDLSSVIANKGQANPGSLRRFSMADALYVGVAISDAPTQFVRFYDGGIEIVSPSKIKMNAPDIEFDCQTLEINAATSTTITTPTFTVNGNSILAGTVAQTGGGAATFSGSIVALGDVSAAGKSLDLHTHNIVNVQSGSSTITSTVPN